MLNKDYLLDCKILHEIRGRIRIKSRALKYLGIHKEEITKQLMQVHYIQSVEISSITGTILVYFDNFSLTGENLISLLQNTLNTYLLFIFYHTNTSCIDLNYIIHQNNSSLINLNLSIITICFIYQ